MIEIPKEGDGLYEAMMLKLGPKTLAWVLGLAEQNNALIMRVRALEDAVNAGKQTKDKR